MSSLMGFWPFKSFFSYVFKRSFGKFLKNNIDLSLYDFSKKKITFKNLDVNTQVDIIIMPVFQTKEKVSTEETNIDIQGEDKKEEEDQQEEPQKTEEFNVSSITVRLLTKEISQDMNEDIPTLLIRLNNIEYRRFLDQNPDQRPVSDLQVILDGKVLELQEISVHYMKSTHLYPDEFNPKSPQLSKLKFPTEYPLINHPSTILIIRPLQSQQKALEVKLSFNKEVPQNKLYLQVSLPNIESIIQLNQLKGILTFSNDIANFVHRKENPQLQQDNDFLTKPQATLDDNILDIYGTMIRNNQSIKELNVSPQLNKKANSVPVGSQTSKLGKHKKKNKKMNLRKEKMICQFLQKTQDKQEFLKLKEDLKKSVMQSCTEEALIASQLLDQSMMQTTVQDKTKSKPLSINLEANIPKISVTIILNENGITYDNIYDSYAFQNGNKDNQLLQVLPIDEQSLRRYDQKIGYSHYNLEIRNIAVNFTLSNIKNPKAKSHNPFAKVKNEYDKLMKVQLKVKSLQMNRYDISDCPSLQQIQHQQQQQQNQTEQSFAQYESFTSNSVMFQSAQEFYALGGQDQYESKILLEKSSFSKRNHQQPSGHNHQWNMEQSCNSKEGTQEFQQQQTTCLYNVFKMNHYCQHFCKQNIIDIRPILGNNETICDMQIQIKEEFVKDKSTQKTQGQLQLGFCNINIGYNDFLMLSQLFKGLNIEDHPQIQEQQNQKPKVLEYFDFKIEGIKLDFISISNKCIDLPQILGSLIENKPLQQMLSRICYCNDLNNIQSTLLVLVFNNVNIRLAKDQQVQIKSDTIEAQTVIENQQITLIEFQKLLINISKKFQTEEDQINQSQLQEVKPIIVFEGQDYTQFQRSQRSDTQASKPKINSNLPQMVSLQISVQQIISEINIKFIQQYIWFIAQIEQTIKFLLIIQDLIKCYNYESKLSSQEKLLKSISSFIDTPVKKQSIKQQTILSINLIFEDIQLIVIDNTENKKAFNSICKLRLYQLSTSLKVTPSAIKEKILINIQVQDLFFLDYLQNISEFHPMSYKKAADHQSVMIVPNPIFENFIAPINSTFLEELQISAPFVLLYKQQGLQNKYSNPRGLELKLDIIFKIEKQIEDKLSTDLIATHFVGLQSNHVLQLFEEINVAKKNPMFCNITLGLQGLILRLQLEYSLIQKWKNYDKLITDTFTVFRKSPISPQSQINDQVKFHLDIEDLGIDYYPSLRQDLYDKMFHSDLISAKIQSIKEQFYFRTQYRAFVFLGELKIDINNSKQNKRNEFAVAFKNLGFNILKNNSLLQEYNPILLLDFNQSLDQAGGQAYLDHLGFVQLLSIDLIEISYIENYGIFIDDNDNNLNELTQELAKEDEDLYETTFDGNQKRRDKIYKQKLLTFCSNKFSLYLAKDSYDAVKQFGKIIKIQIDDLQNQLNPNKKKKSQKKKKNEPETNPMEQEGVHKIIEQFLFLDYDPDQDKIFYGDFSKTNLNQSQDQNQFEQLNKPNLSQIDSILINRISEDGYFTIVSALINDKDYIDNGISEMNLKALVQDDYLPVLNENDINNNRHRYCHILTSQQQEYFLKVKFLFEIQSFDLKLFDGSDFDFIKLVENPKQSQLSQSSLNNSMMSSQFSQLSSSQYMQNQPLKQKRELFTFEDDYISKNDRKEVQNTTSISQFTDLARKHQYPQFSKRPRKTARGNYVSLQIKNLLLTFNQMLDLPENPTTNYYRICFSIQQLILKESISKQGQMIRELLQLPYSYQYDNQVEIIVQYDVYGEEKDELGFQVKIQPFKMLLNQAVFTFFQKFFDIDFNAKKTQEQQIQKIQLQRSQISSQLSDSQKYQKPIFVNQLKIYPFQMILSYTSKQLNLYDLTSGNLIEFLNIFNINDLKINVKKYDLKQKILLEQAVKHLLQFYKDDLVHNQKINFVKAIGPIRSVFNVVGAFYGVLKKPYQGYYSDKGMIKGFSEGFYGLYNVLQEESTNFQHKLMCGVHKVGFNFK